MYRKNIGKSMDIWTDGQMDIWTYGQMDRIKRDKNKS